MLKSELASMWQAEDAAAAEQAEQRRALPKQRCMSMDAETEQPSAPHKVMRRSGSMKSLAKVWMHQPAVPRMS